MVFILVLPRPCISMLLSSSKTKQKNKSHVWLLNPYIRTLSYNLIEYHLFRHPRCGSIVTELTATVKHLDIVTDICPYDSLVVDLFVVTIVLSLQVDALLTFPTIDLTGTCAHACVLSRVWRRVTCSVAWRVTSVTRFLYPPNIFEPKKTEFVSRLSSILDLL